MKKTLTMMLMDPPYEDSRTATALRIADAAIKKGHHVNVFAFEGAVSLSLNGQKPHPNPVHETTVEEENHPTTAGFVQALFDSARDQGVQLDWVNCGFCVAERGAENALEATRKGGPPDFAKMLENTHTTLVIATK